MSFDYSASPVPVRDDLVQAHERAWERLARPGSWWTGVERVEIAAEVRNALDCALCRERKAALSPFSVDGAHDATAKVLPSAAVDAVHRLVTDAGRLTQSWLEKNAANGLSDTHYVELLGVVVTVLSIDEVHRGLGLPPAPLPEPRSGEPSRERPEGLESGIAFVPMLTKEAADRQHPDLYGHLPIAPNVLRALSLVPDEVRQLKELSLAHYLRDVDVGNPAANGRALSRAQIELIAGRVSALNECFY